MKSLINLKKEDDSIKNVWEVDNVVIEKKLQQIIKKYNLEKINEAIPKESILFHNYVFKQIDEEDFFTESYIAEIFQKVVWQATGEIPNIIKQDGKFIVEYENFKVEIEQLEFNKNLYVNKIFFILDQNGKPQLEKDLAVISSIVSAFKFYKLPLICIQDSLKIQKHKKFLKSIIEEQQEDKTKLLQNIKELKNTFDVWENWEVKPDIEHIKKTFSYLLKNSLWLLPDLQNLNKLTDKSQNLDTNTDKVFYEIVKYNNQQQLITALNVIENNLSAIEVIAFAENAKELLEKINIKIQDNQIVIIKEKTWRFEKLWKKIKWKLLDLKNK